MNMQFKVGDRVKLKSGGPVMTVDSLEDDEKVKCSWFEGSNLKSNLFHKDVLKHDDDNGGNLGLNQFKVSKG